MNERTRERAEAAFKRKEEARLEGDKAMAEYRARQVAVHEKTARLRALRLARDEASNQAVSPPSSRITWGIDFRSITFFTIASTRSGRT